MTDCNIVYQKSLDTAGFRRLQIAPTAMLSEQNGSTSYDLPVPMV